MSAARRVPFVRWMLTAGLVFGVYRETGPCTAIFAGLVVVTLELNDATLQGILDCVRTIGDRS